MDQKLCNKNVLFHSVRGYYFKKHLSLFWHYLNPIWVQKATGPILHQSWNMRARVQHYYGPESNPPPNASPSVGNSRQNSEAMAVFSVQNARLGTGAPVVLHHREEDIMMFQMPFNRRYSDKLIKNGQLSTCAVPLFSILWVLCMCWAEHRSWFMLLSRRVGGQRR